MKFSITLLLISSFTAAAHAAPFCDNPYSSSFDIARASLVKVVRPKAGFRMSLDAMHCPIGRSCRDDAFVVVGDALIVTKADEGYVCATYAGRKGKSHTGWITASDVVPEPSTTPPIDTWLGGWRTSFDQSIDITSRGNTGQLTVDGFAELRSQLHTGTIAGSIAPVGGLAGFALDIDDTSGIPVKGSDGETRRSFPYDAPGGDGVCRLEMRRLGPYLLVRDNDQCGGAFVTFSGVYAK